MCSALVYFLLLEATYTLVFWLPDPIQSWASRTLLLFGIYAAIPNAVGVIGMILIGRNSDKLRERRWHFGRLCCHCSHRPRDYHAAQGQLVGSLFGAIVGDDRIAAATPLFFTLITEYLSKAGGRGRHRRSSAVWATSARP